MGLGGCLDLVFGRTVGGNILVQGPTANVGVPGTNAGRAVTLSVSRRRQLLRTTQGCPGRVVFTMIFTVCANYHGNRVLNLR